MAMGSVCVSRNANTPHRGDSSEPGLLILVLVLVLLARTAATHRVFHLDFERRAGHFLPRRLLLVLQLAQRLFRGFLTQGLHLLHGVGVEPAAALTQLGHVL